MDASSETNLLADDALVRGTASVGNIEVIVCTDGTCRFDGGAMFGVVPKAVWNRKTVADEFNRVLLGLNCVVVRAAGKTILIETGFTNRRSSKLLELYGLQGRLPRSLAAAGVDVGDVDMVINTHLHWDHCSWNTVDVDGKGVSGKCAEPFFPNAQYIAHRGEVEHGRRQFERDGISYVADNYEPLISSGQMRMLDDSDFGPVARPVSRLASVVDNHHKSVVEGGETVVVCPVADGISLEVFPGHTEHMMVVHIESAGEHACFVSDLVPTTSHLDLAWTMGFDLDPMRVIEERKRFYARAIPENWLVLFSHDHRVPMARLSRDEKGRVVITP